MSFLTAWLWGPWYSLGHCSHWLKPPRTTLFYCWPLTSVMVVRFHCAVPSFSAVSETFYDDWKEFGKGFHGCMSLHSSSTAEGLQTLPFKLCLYVITITSDSLSCRLFRKYCTAGWKKLIENSRIWVDKKASDFKLSWTFVQKLLLVGLMLISSHL